MAAPRAALEPSLAARRFRWRSFSWAWWLAAGVLVFAVPFSAAYALESYGLLHVGLLAFGSALLNTTWRNLAECAVACVCVALALTIRGFPAVVLESERAFARFAARRTQAVLFAGALPLIVRIAVLPVLRVPDPLVADEFGYLLLARTFALGRLTNPTHPFWRHFETVYVFHQPTYTSIYPVAPAVLLAIPELLGAHPWIAVWFAAGLMCALICWMLQGWLPPKWALLGGLLAVSRFTVVSSWMNTYWGGATAAIGGALVLGALPRIMKYQRRRDALLFALGLAVLAQSRPYEGMLFSLAPAGMLGWWLLREKRVALPVRLTRVALPLAVAMALVVAATLWYQWRVTGNPLLAPYLLHQRIYGTPQTLFWQKAVQDAPGVHHYQDIADVFRWQLDAHNAGFSWSSEGARLAAFWQFYLQPLLTLPLLMLPLIVRKRRMAALALSAAALLVGNAMYPFFFPHYAAPICGLLILFIVTGMRYLRVMRWRGRPVGATAYRGLVLAIAASAIVTTASGMLQPWHVSATFTPRGEALKQLKARGGKHLVLVKYSPQHEFHYGVVFNDADIDGSQVVWARQLDSESDKELINYFHDRQVWLFRPDETPVSLVPFTDKPFLIAVAAGAGRRDDTHDGVSPGSIAVLMGGNFARRVHGGTVGRPLPRLPVRLLSVGSEHGDLFGPCEADEEAKSAGGFPLSVDGVSVQFGGKPAPILAVSNQDGHESVTVQVPFDVPTGETTVSLRADGLVAMRSVTVLPATPGVFQMRMSDGRVRGIVLHQDGTVADLQHPAHRGETVRMFSTGLGAMLPRVTTNQPGADDGGAQPVERLIVGVNHQGAALISARYAAGMVGVEEVVFRISPDVPPGPDVPLSIGVVVNGRTVYSNKSSLPVQ